MRYYVLFIVSLYVAAWAVRRYAEARYDKGFIEGANDMLGIKFLGTTTPDNTDVYGESERA